MLLEDYTFGEYLPIWDRFRYDHHDNAIFLTELKERFPFDDKSLRLSTWTHFQTVLIYYSLNTTDLKTLEPHILRSLIEAIDCENILELLENHLGHGVCPSRDAIVVSEFIPLLEKKEVPIPEHLNCLLCDKSPTPSKMQLPKVQQNSKNIDRTTKKRIYDPLVLRKEAITNKAKIIWLKERREIENGTRKEYTKAPVLALKPELTQLAIELNVELTLPPLGVKSDEMDGFNEVKDNPKELKNYLLSFNKIPERLVDPDWIREFYPGDD